MTEIGFFEEVWISVASGNPLQMLGFVCAVIFVGYVIYAVFLGVRYVCRMVSEIVNEPFECKYCDKEASQVDGLGNPCCDKCVDDPKKYQAISCDQLVVLEPGELDGVDCIVDRDDE